MKGGRGLDVSSAWASDCPEGGLWGSLTSNSEPVPLFPLCYPLAAQAAFSGPPMTSPVVRPDYHNNDMSLTPVELMLLVTCLLESPACVSTLHALAAPLGIIHSIAWS